MNQALLTVEDVKKFIIEGMKRDRSLTRKELAEELNISLQYLDKCVKRGMPWFGKVTRKKFILSDVKKWFIDNPR